MEKITNGALVTPPQNYMRKKLLSQCLFISIPFLYCYEKGQGHTHGLSWVLSWAQPYRVTYGPVEVRYPVRYSVAMPRWHPSATVAVVTASIGMAGHAKSGTVQVGNKCYLGRTTGHENIDLISQNMPHNSGIFVEGCWWLNTKLWWLHC